MTSEPKSPAEQLEAIDTVADAFAQFAFHAAPRVALDSLRNRITRQLEDDREIGRAFERMTEGGSPGDRGTTVDPALIGAVVRAAVQATGATITAPSRLVEPAEIAARG